MKYDNGTTLNPVKCEHWEQAYDCARERQQPIVAKVGVGVGRCFPSGRFEELVCECCGKFKRHCQCLGPKS